MMHGYAFWAFALIYILPGADNIKPPNLQTMDTRYLRQLSPGLVCPNGYFACETSPKCLMESLRCDGEPQCPDHSDEQECQYKEYDEEEISYWNHMFRKQPAGINDHIPRGVCFLPNANVSSCTCRAHDMLCDYRNWTSLPLDLPQSNMMMLDLSYNNFIHIKSSFLNALPSGITIDILVLKFCHITKIDPNAFKAIKEISLRSLYLSQNQIKFLSGPLFDVNTGLSELILSGNLIDTIHVKAFLHLAALEELDLRDNLIEKFSRQVFEPLQGIKRLYLCNNRLKFLKAGMFPALPLNELSLLKNRIERIEKNSWPFENLTLLYLDSNRLTELGDNSFCNLTQLKSLILLKNRIEKINVNAFACNRKLSIIDLTENPLQAVDKRVFENFTNLNKISFSRFQLCHAVHQVAKKCSPTNDGISSRTALVDNKIIRYCLAVIVPVILFGNLGVFVCNILHNTPRSNFEHSMYQRCLAVSGCFMGIYFAAIAGVDLYFQGDFNRFGYEWRHDGACSVLGFTNTLNHQASTILLMFMTWDRFKAVTTPLNKRVTNEMTVYIQLIVTYLVSIILAAIPFLPIKYFEINIYGTNTLCIPLYIEYPFDNGWQYSAFLFMGMNTFALIFTIVCWIRIMYAIRHPPPDMTVLTRDKERGLTKRFTVMLSINVLCWLSMIGYKIRGFANDPSFYPWLVLVIVPFKCAWNPIVFSIATLTHTLASDTDDDVNTDATIMEVNLPMRDLRPYLNTRRGMSYPNRSIPEAAEGNGNRSSSEPARSNFNRQRVQLCRQRNRNIAEELPDFFDGARTAPSNIYL